MPTQPSLDANDDASDHQSPEVVGDEGDETDQPLQKIRKPRSARLRQQCELCQRLLKRGTTKHHLIPRTCHKNRWFKKNYTREQQRETVDLCHDCHGAIHRMIPSEKELGRYYNTLELLRAHPAVAKYLVWIVKQS